MQIYEKGDKRKDMPPQPPRPKRSQEPRFQGKSIHFNPFKHLI